MTSYFGPGTRMIFRTGRAVHLKRAYSDDAVCGAWKRRGTRYKEPIATNSTLDPKIRYLPAITCGNCAR